MKTELYDHTNTVILAADDERDAVLIGRLSQACKTPAIFADKEKPRIVLDIQILIAAAIRQNP